MVCMENEYNAKSIRILSAKDIQGFDWNRARQVADDYNKPIEFVSRGFEACRLAGLSPDWFINKYLEKEAIPDNPEFLEIYKDLLKNIKNKR